MHNPLDNECICNGNWRNIIKEIENLIGRVFLQSRDNEKYRFIGLLHADDDYYYAFEKGGKSFLYSCVGDLEGWGFTLMECEHSMFPDEFESGMIRDRDCSICGDKEILL